jgi:hypothetical protein
LVWDKSSKALPLVALSTHIFKPDINPFPFSTTAVKFLSPSFLGEKVRARIEGLLACAACPSKTSYGDNHARVQSFSVDASFTSVLTTQ